MAAQRKIQLSKPCLGPEEWDAVKEPIDCAWLAQGPKVAEFENMFADIHKVKNAIATSSCTAGLHLILEALNVGPGDEVIVPAFTWISTANVVMYCGATPVFVDIDPTTFNINPEQVADKVTNNTKAIIVVHLFGLYADIERITKAAPGIVIIEDAACAVGGYYKNKSIGCHGIAAAFSFHPRKAITTGEGGMVATNNDDLAEKLMILRNLGASKSKDEKINDQKPYILPDFNLLGYNYRMTDIQAAIGLVQLNKLDSFIDERQKWAKYYRNNLNHITWMRFPEEPAYGRHSWQAFVVRIESDKAPLTRNQIMEFLQSKGIATRPGTLAIHMLGYYKNKFNFKPEDYPKTYYCYENTIALPLHNSMSENDYNYIVECIKELN